MPVSIRARRAPSETNKANKSNKTPFFAFRSSRHKVVGLIAVSSVAALSWVLFFHNVIVQTLVDQQRYSDFDFFKSSSQSHNGSFAAGTLAATLDHTRPASNKGDSATRKNTTVDSSTSKRPLPPNADGRNAKALAQLRKSASEYDVSKKSVSRFSGTTQQPPLQPNDESRKRCFPYNSEHWLSAGENRAGNTNDPWINEDFVLTTVINADSLLHEDSRSLLKQSLCLPNSKFLSLDMTNEELANPTNQTIHFWSQRLIYLAAHLHQHLPAKPEAQVRRREHCASEMDSLTIGTFDYECPDTKFLIFSLAQKGLGATMRLGAVSALVAGIASNRTVVFINNSPQGPKFLRNPWMHASCPRRDAQCFFMPLTPCVLTNEDIKFAPTLARGEARALFKTGAIPHQFRNLKALIVDLVLRPQKTPATFRGNVVNIANEFLINPLIAANPADPRIGLLSKAVEFINEPEPLGETYYYYGHNVKHHHALVFYAMRPNHHYTEKLRHIVEQTFSDSFDPELAFGLPIRASDKCIAESECRSFDEYMRLVDHTWNRHKAEFLETHSDKNKMRQSDPSTSIIVTSEAPNVREAQVDFLRQGLHKNLSLSFDFVNNGFDLQQGSGNPKAINSKSTNITYDEIMLSSISTLKVQLHARYTVGNCCSNFHLLLFDFLKGGCGATYNQVAECIQDSELPEFRLCCEWSKTEECLAKRNTIS